MLTSMARIACLASVVTLAPGCSLLFVEGPPSRHESIPYFVCTESYAWPVIDSLVAGLSGANFGMAVTGNVPDGDDAYRTMSIVSGVVWLGVYTTSAVVGYGRVRRCKGAMERWAERPHEGSQTAIGTGQPLPQQ